VTGPESAGRTPVGRGAALRGPAGDDVDNAHLPAIVCPHSSVGALPQRIRTRRSPAIVTISTWIAATVEGDSG
jgi:hypothetical protein